MPRPCEPCSPRTCCPATSTPISAHRGYRRATSRHSPPTCSTSSRPSVPVAHLKKDAVWSLDADYAAKASVAATSEFGTARANGTWLLELALNMKSPTIYDTIQNGDREERVVNQEATLAAREKQKLIKERFRSWVFTDPDRTERLVRIYNDTYNNLRPRLFDGSHLDFPGMNQTIKLRPHQDDAVWRGMSSGNTLLAHAVGAGKTFTMAATGMKMKQAGLIKKPMYVVPNHLLEQFSREFMQLYPNAKLLVAAKEDLTRDRRKFLTAKIASGEWDGIIVTHSSFERIGMSRDYQEKFLLEQIAEYDELLREHAGAKGANRNLIKTIEKQKAARAERLKDLLAEDKKDDGLVFDELGVDHVFIDEAHYFKNLETPTKMDRVAGIQTGGSERAFDVYMKARYLDEQHAGHGVTFATGTPISNTMVEMYTMQRFLDPEGLRSRGLEHFDAWAATFGEVIDTMEISPDGAGLRPRSRFARFTNLPELQQMFRAFSDVQTAEMLNLPRPRLEGGKPIVVACPMSEEQHALQQELVERYERLRSQKVDPRVDNALAITTDGRKLATDARMLSATAPDFPESKVNRLVENVAAIWQRTAATRGTQMIFCRHGRQSYPLGVFALRRDHQETGRPRHPPRADRRHRRRRIRRQETGPLREGQARLGARADRQHAENGHRHQRPETPGRPASPRRPLEAGRGRATRRPHPPPGQRERGSGDLPLRHRRIIRRLYVAGPGNQGPVHRQVITGDNAARRAEDIGGQELSYAEVKAIASGNPAVLTLAEADAELQRLTLLKKNHLDEQYVARRSVRDLPATIASLSERLVQAHGGRGHRESPRRRPDHHRQPHLPTRRRTRHPRRPARRLADERPRDDPRPARHLPGPAFWHGPSSAIPARRVPRRRHHATVHAVAGPPGAACRPERPGTPGRRLRLRMRPRPARPRHRRIPASRLPGPPGQALPARRLPVRTDQPCVTSSRPAFPARPRSQATKKGRAFPNWPSRSRRSRPRNSIEATPQRVRQKHSSAEEPVTARIRRRTEAIPASDPAIQPDAAASAAGAAPPPAPAQNSSTKPQMTFQERIAMERQRKDQEPSLP